MPGFQYLRINKTEEALSALEIYGERAALLAGGSDLMLAIRQGKLKPEVIIPLKGIRELSGGIERKEDGIWIGAMTSLSEIAGCSHIRKDWQALAEAAGKVGSRQIRNWATIGGNICHASPAADTVPALLVCGAEVKLIGRAGTRSMLLSSFLLGPNKTALEQGEMLESIRLPLPEAASASCYLKLGRREGVDLAIIGAAVFVSESGETRIAVGGAGPTAFRAYEAEKVLREELPTKEPPSGEVLTRALSEVAAAAHPITDIRASAEYRLAMVEVLTRRALETAWKRLHARRTE